MDDYNKYVTAVNRIYDFLEKMKIGWNNTDNKNYIDTIDDFKNTVISKAEDIKKPPTVKLEKTSAELLEEQRQAEEEALVERVKEHQQNAIMQAATVSEAKPSEGLSPEDARPSIGGLI